MQETVTVRFLKCHDYLKNTGQLKSSATFAADIGVHRQTFYEIQKGRREVRVEMVEEAILKYNFNPAYLFSGKGDMFIEIDDEPTRKGNISLVPIRAQAGYCEHIMDPVYKVNLPKFNIPLGNLKSTDLTCFEVEGESMYPTLQDGNYVLCEKILPAHYYHSIKQDKVYVVITEHEVLVKRADALLYPSKKLVLHSDNSDFKTVQIHIELVKEVWRVEHIILTHVPPKPRQDKDWEGKIKELISEMSIGE